MSLRINTNMSALVAHNTLERTNKAVDKAMERLSTGQSINRGSDDAAGLSISENLRADINGLNQAQKNAQDGMNMINTADGGLDQIHAVLQRMRELAVQGSNDTLNSTDRTNMDNEFTELKGQIDDISSRTTFNGQSLLNGSHSYTFQVGSKAGETLTYSTADMSTAASGLNVTTNDLTTQSNASSAITALDSAISAVSAHRATIGAKANRLDYTSNTLSVTSENLSAAQSRIRDTDMASEMANLTRNNVISQAGMSMLSQANQGPQSVLNLLRG